MGTTVDLTVVGAQPAVLVEFARHQLSRWENAWSRFLPYSEISRLNRSVGEAMVLDDETIRLLTFAISAWEATGGRFSPFLERDLRTLGYSSSNLAFGIDRGFDVRPDSGRDATGRLVRQAAGEGVDEVLGFRRCPLEIDDEAGTARLLSGFGVDLGGVAKGYAADRLVELLLERGAHGAMVNVGGDLAVGGTDPEGQGWTVEICDPTDRDRVIERIALFEGGVAASSTHFRSWTVGSDQRHHILDPVDGMPTRSGLVGAVVVADSAAHAEVLTKVALVAGRDLAASTLRVYEVDAYLFRNDGSVEYLNSDVGGTSNADVGADTNVTTISTAGAGAPVALQLEGSAA